MSPTEADRPVLVTGATGYIGRVEIGVVRGVGSGIIVGNRLAVALHVHIGRRG